MARTTGSTARSALGQRLHSTAIHLLRRIGRDDGADGVTGARLSALSVLVFGGPRTAGQLARAERVSSPTMTRVVDGLVREGLVRRLADPADRRVVRVEATPRGRRLMERGRARRLRHLERELATLDGDSLRTLEAALGILERLETGAPPGAEEKRDG